MKMRGTREEEELVCAYTVRAHLDYFTQPCDIIHVTILGHFLKMG